MALRCLGNLLIRQMCWVQLRRRVCSKNLLDLRISELEFFNYRSEVVRINRSRQNAILLLSWLLADCKPIKWRLRTIYVLSSV